MLKIALYKRIWNTHLSGVANNHSFASYHLLLFRCCSFCFLFLDRRRPLARPQLSVPWRLAPVVGEASTEMAYYHLCPPPCGGGTDGELDGCFGWWLNVDWAWVGRRSRGEGAGLHRRCPPSCSRARVTGQEALSGRYKRQLHRHNTVWRHSLEIIVLGFDA